jgi:hypothetical protein
MSDVINCYTVREAARRANRTRAHIRGMITRGQLPAFRRPDDERWWIAEADLQTYINANEPPSGGISTRDLARLARVSMGTVWRAGLPSVRVGLHAYHDRAAAEAWLDERRRRRRLRRRSR